MPYQIRTIGKARLVKPMGRLEDLQTRNQIEERIMEHIGINLDEEVGE